MINSPADTIAMLLRKGEKLEAENVVLKADAARMRWLLNGHGYFMEENMLCGHAPCSEYEKDEARHKIDAEMKEGS